jgi:hypothetical protein
MKQRIVVAVALLVIVGVVYWAVDGVRSRTYTGSNLSFAVGSGRVLVTNLGDAPVPVEMRTQAGTSLFRVESSELELRTSASRQGSGRDAYYAVNFELPPGQALIDVTRGSGVYFVAGPEARLQAVVWPREVEGVRWTLGFAGAVVLVALYYISRAFEHRWISHLRGRWVKRDLRSSTAG